MQTTESNKISIWRCKRIPLLYWVHLDTARSMSEGGAGSQSSDMRLIAGFTAGSAAQASHQFCTVTAPWRVTAPRDSPLHIKARDTLLPLCAVWISPLLRGLSLGRQQGHPLQSAGSSRHGFSFAAVTTVMPSLISREDSHCGWLW